MTDQEDQVDQEDRVQILYTTDGSGRWWKREWARQCPVDPLLMGRCQGTEGHAGEHWRYYDDGSYCWSINHNEVKDIKPTDAVTGRTPPDHPSWISPSTKVNDYHVANYVDSEVIDPTLLAKLEADDPDYEIEGSINRPCTNEEIEDLRQAGRLPPELAIE